MTPKFDVIVCGSLHLDIVVNAKALPLIDETAVGHAWRQVCGGKGGNQAVQAAQAGAKTAMMGRIGDDAFGKTLNANLVANHVDVSCIRADATAGSGMSVAIVQDDGDYGAVIVSGANLLIDAATPRQDWAALGGGKILVLQNEISHGVNVAMAKTAREAGATVVLNAAPARDMVDELLSAVDVLVVNRVEAELMGGVAIADRTAARTALKTLAVDGRSVIITLGGDGCVGVSASGDVFEIAPIKVDVTSTHGAGDCFVGVLAAELAKGAPLVEASNIANRAAAKHVSRAQ
jgi:ribokinase